MYVRAAIEDLPPELAGIADRLTVVLPWGSLLAAVACPAVAALQGIRRLCQPEATLTLVLSIDAARDRGEALRLRIPPLDDAHFRGPWAAAYAMAGFTVTGVRTIDPDQLTRWPTSWARRLAHGRARSVFQVEARATCLIPPEGGA